MDQLIKPWKRLAFVFPGQGSHHVGMGKRLSEVSRAARELFRQADEILERRLSRLCFEGPEEDLEKTVNQQPASFVVAAAWLAALQERCEALDRKLEAHFFAGHSMGEFTAAYAAGTVDFEEGLRLVTERGLAMEAAGLQNPGGMASIIGLPEERVIEICQESSHLGTIGLATFNCEGQTVISGEIPPLLHAMDIAKKSGARKAVRLPISIASHCALMQPASEQMAAVLDTVTLRDPEKPFVGNINADFLHTSGEVLGELKGQLTAGVRWKHSVEHMIASGADLFIEIGPGNVLTRIVRRIGGDDVSTVAISDERDGLLSDSFASVESAAQ